MLNTQTYKFTVIVPVYNEMDNIYTLETRLSAFLPECLLPACVLFVDDGSTDGSSERIAEICSRNEAFHYIRLSRNCGLSSALKAGIDHVDTEYLGYMDADLQTAPEDFNLLLKHIGSYSLVTGMRVNRKDSPFRRFQSLVANSFRKMMTGDGAADTGCPLKVMHTSSARKLPLFKGMHRFIPALVLLQDGGKYLQVPVRHFVRTAGQSKYGLWNRVFRSFLDCFAYRWMKSRYINYSISASDFIPVPGLNMKTGTDGGVPVNCVKEHREVFQHQDSFAEKI